jgi:methylated-DNA-[protein]-cysteine S-methyltransferase
MIDYQLFASPLGPMRLAAGDAGLVEIAFLREGWAPASHWRERSTELLRQTRRQLDEYFAGARRDFDLPLAAQGTGFQQRVWAELRAIPYASTASYVDIARRLGDAKAVRAVGMANGRNPLGIVVPCHRVIGADGSLTGYAGGLERKRALLELEGAPCSAGLFAERR